MADPLLLLYRADWTRWSFSAEVLTRQNGPAARSLTDQVAADFRRRTSGALPIATRKARQSGPEWSSSSARVLIAPGGRYRYQPPVDTDDLAGSDTEEVENNERVTLAVSDGEFCWTVWCTEAERYPADPARTPIDRIIRPNWLLSQLRLTATGTTQLAGRPMLMVRGKPRPRPSRWGIGIALLDRVDLLIDAELGVVLRRQAVYQGQPLSVFELRDFTVDPPAAADPANFRPDSDVAIDEEDSGPDRSAPLWNDTDWLGADWAAEGYAIDAGTVAVSLAKGALYLAARSVSRPEPAEPERTDDQAEMPAPLPGETATPLVEPICDRTLRLIAQAGRPSVNVSAQVHHWINAKRATTAGPSLTTGSEKFDFSAVASFLGIEGKPALQVRNTHRIASLRVAMPDWFRLDFLLDERGRWPRAIACDGERLRKIYHNRVIVSPARTLPTDFVRLIEPAWLLADWRLTEGGEETFAGRTAIRVQAVPPPHPPRLGRDDSERLKSIRIVVLIDAELGIILRQVSYADDEPVAWIELRELAVLPEADQADFGPAIASDLPVISTSGEPVDDLDLPPVAKSIRDVSSGLLAMFRRPR